MTQSTGEARAACRTDRSSALVRAAGQEATEVDPWADADLCSRCSPRRLCHNERGDRHHHVEGQELVGTA